ncbi:hypothetical protein SH528x_005850 [Novipirellula sp. SH528]|uniref:hypothetical protein n=1 Tax=Novipirellula sp. SH528 TaxID=3454466 RepID=UPI003FA057A7
MGLRQVALIVQQSAPLKLATGLLLSAAIWIPTVSADETSSDGGQVRVASYKMPSGDAYFAASLQPSASDSLMNAVRDAEADIVIVVDTSASQVGEYRRDSIAALRSAIEQLRTGDRVRLFAADVKTADLSGDFDSPSSSMTQNAIAKLGQRLPLGNTNLITVIDSIRATLVGEPANRTRSVVYIGDGSSLEANADKKRFEALVDTLRSDRISVHSILIGPTANIEVMGILANQTGGVLGVVGTGENVSPVEISRQVGKSASMSPIWLSDAKLTEGMKTVQQDRLPPLRLDRDSILLGHMKMASGEVAFQLKGETTSANVAIQIDGTIETSHPDFAFLPGLVDDSADNRGLMLATAGSPMLRETAHALATQSEDLVRAANIAVKQGNMRGAKAIAEKALKADPNNPEAKAIETVTEEANTLIIQNPADSPFDDIFGGGDAPMDEGGDVFGSDTAAEAGGDVFGGDDPAPAVVENDPMDIQDEAPAAAKPAAAPRQPAPRAAAPPRNVAQPRNAAPMRDNNFFGPAAGDDELLESGGDLLDRVEAEQSLAEGRLRAEVNSQLRAARRQLVVDPQGVSGSLKSLLGRIEITANVSPAVRKELMGEVRSAIQLASSKEARFMDAQANLEQQAKGANSMTRLLEETFRTEQSLKTLSEQMNALIDEGRYEEADGEVSIPFARLAGDTITRDSTAGRQFIDYPLWLQTYARDRRYTEMRDRNFVDAFSLVLKAAIPFVDEPPVVWPEADAWQKLSRRRIERYGAIELVGDNDTERRIQATLSDETSQIFVETPLEEAIQKIATDHDIPIVIDRRALEEIGLTADSPVTIELKNVSLRSFMRLLLRELDLTYMIKDEVMQITTQEAAEENLVTKVYPVGDLVVPVMQLGGGGMGGGQGGGMGGGMGGGGMGGGMGGGGMGGGMGGGGMGGGGMFAVPDDVSLQNKTTASTPATRSENAASKPVAKPAKKTISRFDIKPIRLQVAEGQSKAEAWDQFFASEKIESAEDLTRLDQRIRSTVREWSTKALKFQESGKPEQTVACFVEMRDTIAAAMRAGHVQTWMYQAYAIALKATNAPKEEIERTLLSAVDFAETPEEVLHVAARLEEVGSGAAALQLCKKISALDPYRREPYLMGLRIAQQLNDVDALSWACSGVLSQAWPEKFQPIVEQARLVARATHSELIAEGRTEDAQKFSDSLRLAASHDAIVRVSWTGDADLDVAVEEPSGTVCAIDSPSSAGGGTLLGDSFPGRGDDELGTVSETYLCPKGFTGKYRLLIRRVWGDVSTGNATVEIITDVGRPTQRFIREEIPIGEQDALVVFEVKEGQRKEDIAAAQLAHLRDVQRDMNHDALAQFAGDGPDAAQVLQNLFNDVQSLTGGSVGGAGGAGGVGGLGGLGRFNRGAVGFRPEITQLPEGASVSTLAIISSDRRYVRISPVPTFSQVGDVRTFNFVDGDSGTVPGGGGGGGLGGGGFQ